MMAAFIGVLLVGAAIIAAVTFAIPVLIWLCSVLISVLAAVIQGCATLIGALVWCAWFLVDPKGAMAGKPSAKAYRQDASPWGDKPFRRKRA